MTEYPTPIFAQSSLDRMEHLRAPMREHVNAADNRFILISDEGVGIRSADKALLFSGAEIEKIPHDKTQAVFLGAKQNEYYFAVSVSAVGHSGFESIDIRSFAASGFLPDTEMGMIAQAVSILNWHRAHGFCSFCGHQTVMTQGGWRRDCASCGKQHFPRTDPVVIMLVTCGDYCLLGAGRDFKVPDRYSCLAGFMEPGETIEEAARRELLEEADVTVGRVTYMLSQPWPFPSNLMIGVHAEAANMHIKINEQELVRLKWIEKRDITAVLNGATDRDFSLPPRIAVARNMLEIMVTGMAE